MKKAMKKILCSLLVVVMCLTSAPLQGFVDLDWSWLDFSVKASAADELAATGQCGDNVYWNYDSTTGKLVISGSGAMYDYENSSSPFNHSDIKSVVINDSITSIGNATFYYCDNLRIINLPDGIISVGDYAFYCCFNLYSIKISDSIKTIGNYAFYHCDNLQSIKIPDGVTVIGNGAFSFCGLKNVTIPNSVKSIGFGPFSYCENLTGIEVDSNNNYYISDYGVLFDKSETTLIQYPADKNITVYTIPDSVTTIGNRAFWGCELIKSIRISDSVTEIGYGAFSDCDNLKSIVIGNGVALIGDGAFSACKSVENIIIPNSVITIGNRAFADCSSLKSITIGAGVSLIGDEAFDCIRLDSITVDLNNNYYSSDSGVLFDKNKTTLIQYPRYNNRILYAIPNSVTTVSDRAFFGSGKLESVTIPNSVTKIGDSAFSGCDKLESITIPNKLTSIGEYVFYYCETLKSVTLPKSVKSIGNWAFKYCNSLEYVYYTGLEEQWKKISIAEQNSELTTATIYYNYNPAPISYFTISSDTYSVDSIHRKETATYKINLLDENSDFLPIDDVTVQNNTTDIVAISTNKVSDTEIELTVEPLKDGDASISLFNGDSSVEQFFNFTVYSNTTTYRADQVPVTNEKLKTNFSRGDLTVDNFEYYFDENKGKYIATMDVYNSSGAIGVVASYTQDGLISDIEQVDPYVPLPGDFGEFLVYLGSGAVGILKGENWNYRFAGYNQKTPIEIEVPEDGYLTVSCDVTADNAAFIYNLVSVGVDFVFKTAEIIDVLGTDTDKLAKDTTKTLAKKVSEYFNEDSEWTAGAIKKLAKKLSKNFNMAYLEDISALSLEMLDEMYKNVGEDFSEVVLDVIIDLTKEEIKEFGVMAAARKLIKDKVIGTAEKTLLKVASIMFDGGSYVNLLNSILGAYRYNVGTGKTMVVFKPNGEDGFLCKDTIKVTSDIITDEVLLNTYIIKDTQKEDAFVRGRIHPYFNRDDGLDDREISIDLNRVVEIHEISLLKNGQVVTDGFTATVEMYLPSYIDRRTCSVYRVEKDGTYTKLDTKIESGKIIFETDHFSEYILTGIRNDIEGTTPCDEHVYEEVRVEPTCTETGSITYTCYCGDTYTEAIESTGHTFADGSSKCKNCDYNKADNCSCSCHKGGIAGFFFKIILFFQKIFRTNKTCACGIAHY